MLDLCEAKLRKMVADPTRLGLSEKINKMDLATDDNVRINALSDYRAMMNDLEKQEAEKQALAVEVLLKTAAFEAAKAKAPVGEPIVPDPVQAAQDIYDQTVRSAAKTAERDEASRKIELAKIAYTVQQATVSKVKS